MDNILSYLWPQTRKVDSDYNGELELTLINGRKVLDSKNANYSFGSLQIILEIGLSKIDLRNVHSVLLLGLGGGSVISSLRNKYNYKGALMAIEIDQKIIEIAEKEFFISSGDNLTIENLDAFDFVKKRETFYDLIIVDLFIDNKVPEQFYSMEFCDNLSQIMEKESTLLFNLGMGQINKEKREVVTSYFNNKLGFEAFQLENVLNTNALLIVNKFE